MNPQQRRRARIVQGVLLLSGIAISFYLWAATFDGCSFGFGCW